MKYVNPDNAYDYFLGTLSNRTRIKILNNLAKGPKTVSQLTKAVDVDQSTISNNLARLKYCGFVQVKPNGKERIYALNEDTILPLMELINKHVKKYCKDCIKEEK